MNSVGRIGPQTCQEFQDLYNVCCSHRKMVVKKKDSFNFLLGLGLISSIDLEHNGSQEKAQGNLNGP